MNEYEWVNIVMSEVSTHNSTFIREKYSIPKNIDDDNINVWKFLSNNDDDEFN